MLIPPPAAVESVEPAGSWIGHLDSGFKIILQIEKSPGGTYAGRIRTLNGNITELDRVTSNGQHLHFSSAKQELNYEGDWEAAHQKWVGTLTRGEAYALAFRRALPEDISPAQPKRPQETAIAANPAPYSQLEVTITNPGANVTLAGTFSVPAGVGPFPAAILVSGTGPNTRDEEVDGHKVFLVLADALNRQGFAVLRYDKRGAGASTGRYGMATTADFASDAAAALNWLVAQPEVDGQRVGLIGHSEGGLIAPLVAINNPGVSFIVSIAGSALPGAQLFVMQAERVSRAYGVPADYIAKRKSFDEKLYNAALSTPDPQQAFKQVQTVVEEGVRDKIIEPDQAKSLAETTTTPWMRYFLAYNPTETLKQVQAPILVLIGELDLQVPARENLAVFRSALQANPHATLLELPGLNHLLQTARTGSPVEYYEIEETISPTALSIITGWMKER